MNSDEILRRLTGLGYHVNAFQHGDRKWQINVHKAGVNSYNVQHGKTLHEGLTEAHRVLMNTSEMKYRNQKPTSIEDLL